MTQTQTTTPDAPPTPLEWPEAAREIAGEAVRAWFAHPSGPGPYTYAVKVAGHRLPEGWGWRAVVKPVDENHPAHPVGWHWYDNGSDERTDEDYPTTDEHHDNWLTFDFTLGAIAAKLQREVQYWERGAQGTHIVGYEEQRHRDECKAKVEAYQHALRLIRGQVSALI